MHIGIPTNSLAQVVFASQKPDFWYQTFFITNHTVSLACSETTFLCYVQPYTKCSLFHGSTSLPSQRHILSVAKSILHKPHSLDATAEDGASDCAAADGHEKYGLYDA